LFSAGCATTHAGCAGAWHADGRSGYCVPADWRYEAGRPQIHEYFAYAPDRGNDSIPAMLSITHTPVPEQNSPEQMQQAHLAVLRQSDDYQELSLRPCGLGNGAATCVEYTMTFQGKPVHALLRAAADGQSYWAVTYIAGDAYEQYLPDALAHFDSYELAAPTAP
jgi:hypothetical protein